MGQGGDFQATRSGGGAIIGQCGRIIKKKLFCAAFLNQEEIDQGKIYFQPNKTKGKVNIFYFMIYMFMCFVIHCKYTLLNTGREL